MKTSTAGNIRAHQDGFTLIEVLAVVMVLAIVAGLATARFVAGHGGDALQVAAYELASRCRAARANAIRRGSSEVVLIDLATRMVATDRERAPLIIPAAVTIRSETSASERRSQSITGIRFFPTGASTGGTVRLETGTHAYEIRVNWFTGRVDVERTS
jgi:general secretion pathway protein H